MALIEDKLITQKVVGGTPTTTGAEKQARAAKIGIWKMKNAIALWNFRKNKKIKKQKADF